MNNQLSPFTRKPAVRSPGNLRCGPKQMRFAFIEEHCKRIPTGRLCRIVDVTPRGYRAWRRCPASRHQRESMVLLVHIRKQHRLSLNSYGRPRACRV